MKRHGGGKINKTKGAVCKDRRREDEGRPEWKENEKKLIDVEEGKEGEEGGG